MEQIRRIAEMESRLNRASAALARLNAALEEFPALREDAALLAAYYESPLWRTDFDADEAGLLPEDLCRGVLSEDALYNLLADYEAAVEELRAAAENCKIQGPGSHG